jgi:hypothetical protein
MSSDEFKHLVSRYPHSGDTGWFKAPVWDCPNPECGLTRMSPEVEECLLCETAPSGWAVYMGQCWGFHLDGDLL